MTETAVGPHRRTKPLDEYGPSIYDNCGEYAGWNRHKREGTKVCFRCGTARNDYMRDRRHKLGESQGTWVYVPDLPELTDDHYCI